METKTRESQHRPWDKEPYSLAALGVLFIVAGFFLPWSAGLILPALSAGFLTPLRKPVLLPVAFVAALSWILVALVRDTMTGWHLSPRLGGLLGLHFGIAAYVLLGLMSATVALAAAGFGRSLRKEWQAHFDSRSL